ncbi:hypothetical protein OAI12_00645 [Porticoccaceae bacterium]|nr:hypothetical protein [Porticoccaceae bacterium]
MNLVVFFIAAFFTGIVTADGMVIDKIYHPYVQETEQELEFRAITQNQQPRSPDNNQLYRLAYGRSLNDRWFAEVYLTGDQSDAAGFDLRAIELELKWQLTEQGEYWADWGMLFELAKAIDDNIYEISSGIIVEKELGNWSHTANFIVEQEWGADIIDELESTLTMQSRFRYSQLLEPGIEFYKGQNTFAIGPVLMGELRWGLRQKLKWQSGAIFGLDEKSPDLTLRLLLEYEF